MATQREYPGTAKLLVYYDAHQCDLTDDDYDRMTTGLDALARQVEDFPQHDLHVYIQQRARTTDFAVKLSLLLPGRTLVGSDHEFVMHAAFEQALDSLVHNVRAYKDQLGQHPERNKQEKGTHQQLTPDVTVDAAAVEAAVRDGDYPAFRSALAPYEGPLRLRAGRWVERYPEVQARIGKGLETVDIAEAVFLTAFEGYDARPVDERFGEWMDNLLDPAIRAIAHDPDGELENINMARSACEAGPAQG